MIKYVVTLSTLLLGFFYTHSNIRSLISNFIETDYIEWQDFNNMLERQRRLAKV